MLLCSGAGVGKGRTIAGLILENWRCDRKRHLWISIGSDLRVDARRDLNDANGEEIEIHALNKLQYGKLDSDKVQTAEALRIRIICPSSHNKAPFLP